MLFFKKDIFNINILKRIKNIKKLNFLKKSKFYEILFGRHSHSQTWT
jgi:hypothetical protein